MLGQDVDGEMARTGEARIALRRLVDADEHEWRLERERREGVGGETEGISPRVPRRHDRDAGGEMAHDAAELFGIHTEAAGGGAPDFSRGIKRRGEMSTNGWTPPGRKCRTGRKETRHGDQRAA